MTINISEEIEVLNDFKTRKAEIIVNDDEESESVQSQSTLGNSCKINKILRIPVKSMTSIAINEILHLGEPGPF